MMSMWYHRLSAWVHTTPPGEPAGAGYPPLRYYNSEVHRAAFTLPTFARDALAGSLSF